MDNTHYTLVRVGRFDNVIFVCLQTLIVEVPRFIYF